MSNVLSKVTDMTQLYSEVPEEMLPESAVPSPTYLQLYSKSSNSVCQ
jgi:hypothetical protein